MGLTDDIGKWGRSHKSMFLFLIEWFWSTVAPVFCMKSTKKTNASLINKALMNLFLNITHYAQDFVS